MRAELSFYENQVLQETRRINADNAEIFKEHFSSQAYLQLSYINQFHAVWADFMAHFAVKTDEKTEVVNGVLVRKVEASAEYA